MVRELLVTLTEFFVPLIELIALAAIVVGTCETVFGSLRVMWIAPGDAHAAQAVWIRYSRWLVAGLTFQLAADIVETSITPTWEDIGRIGAIALIRTFLNFFLERDQRDILEREREAEIRESQAKPKLKGRSPAKE